ncbi:SGNH/GDSL hydrolase family protein [Xanthomonas sp. NCPPB 2654]|uniref:SGNH/GDSL hydrolase family protein n=1 Tax=unclassified Xanthomonas TaxID=2643310 RepID=UPI0021E009B3|nr:MULTISPECIES: SGNH/GDSL hydrolase family protein [unclassified Xanthomonas]MDL5366858.1 SGNH/GDSL hydrolase family protein [Xanthomonas sp. NCPPB 2654]UYC19937.1 SGNH/GDSL hydrolase family protein [Xanthomonas sp. CFBP 8443]
MSQPGFALLHAPLRYLALGDSYTIGEGVAESGRWPLQLAAALRQDGLAIADPQIIATTGWTTDELDAGIDAAAPQGPFALVTLLIGVNNQYRGRPLDEYREQFAALLQRAIGFADGQPRRVLAVSIPDWGVTPFAQPPAHDPARIGAQIDAFNAAAQACCQARAVRFVDITAASRDGGGSAAMLAADGLHPSAAMYARWTALVVPAARDALA